MPNWTPSEAHIDRLQQIVNHLTNRRATMMEANYPLNAEQVKSIVWPPRMQEFVALGYDSFQKTFRICYELGPEQGLGRRSITQVTLMGGIHYAFTRSLSSDYREQKPAYFNRAGLSDELMEKLKQWTEKAVYERRLAMLTTSTVSEFFEHMPKGRITMYHIMARWPGLKVVFPVLTKQRYRGSDAWDCHSNEVPKNLQRWTWPQYGPEAEWHEKYGARLRLAEENLLSCVSLSENYPERGLTAQVTDWQKLRGMPF